MAGINLLDQLKNKKSGAGLSAPSSSPLKFSFGGGGGGASGDSMSLVLRVLSLGIALYVGYFVLEKLHGDETSKLQTELTQLEKSLAEENIKKTQLKSIEAEMTGYTAKVDELRAKIKAVSLQETDRSYLVRALEYVAIEMPKEIWFNEITATREAPNSGTNSGAESNATFKGYSLNAQAVSDLIQKLEASVYFPTTTLERLEVVAGSEGGLTGAGGVINVPPNSKSFQITAKLGE